MNPLPSPSFPAGTRLGSYEIVAPLGAGGMGEVYRARDSKLDREVAIKVLPEAFAENEERLARFEREAKSLAALNHPNIATVHGFEQEGDTHFLVMELVEGEDLSERIGRGPIPVDEAVPLFVQVAEGLEAAHEKGIIHRDLKPANIMVTEDGRVKILDFGLAKAMEPPTASGDVDMSQSPTMTAAATMRGEIMGTAAYMSPEQASGKTVDKRSDIWAFGVCLYEALTGERAFQGEDAPNTLAAVLRDEIDLMRLSSACPSSVRRLLERCLVKDPRRRLRDIGDARLELEFSAFEDTGLETSGLEDGPQEPSKPRPVLAWLLLALLVGTGLGAFVLSWLRPSEANATSESVVEFSIQLLPEQRLWTEENSPELSLSRDAGSLVFLSDNRGERQLFVRPLDGLEVHAVDSPPLHPESPAIVSSDGAWIAMVNAEGKLSKVPSRGGLPAGIHDLGSRIAFTGTWLTDDTLVLGLGAGQGLVTVDAGGQGEIEQLTQLDLERNEVAHASPTGLPGGRGLLLTVYRRTSDNFHVEVLDRASGERRLLLENAWKAFFVRGGFLVFGRGDTLLAARFDLETLTLTGPETPVLSGVARETFWNRIPLFTVSESGTLVYVPDGQGLGSNRLAWLDGRGNKELLPLEEGTYSTAQLSPDGKTIALDERRLNRITLAKYEIEREQLTELTAVGTFNSLPIWHPDGSRIAFTSNRPTEAGESSGPWAIYSIPLDGAEAELVQPSSLNQQPGSWSSDGRFFAYLDGFDQGDLWVRSVDSEDVDSDGDAFPLEASEAQAATAAFSPTGLRVAYLKVEDNRAEIFVSELDAETRSVGRTEQASRAGGAEPVWSRDGRKLFFRSLDGLEILGVDVGTGPGLQLGPEQVVVETPFMSPPNWWGNRKFDVAEDGRFLIVEGTRLNETMELVVVHNWVKRLESLVE